jgi:DNA-binding PadR family transcriptional regulator
MALLSLVAEEPMHAYRMQQMIKERHQDDVINVAQRNTIYQTIDRLHRDGLIQVRETSREVNRPERTVYEPTQAGLDTLKQWMRTMLATPAREFPEFPAALAFLPVLPPDEAAAALEERVSALSARVTALSTDLTEGAKFLNRLFMVETEYQLAVAKTELDYVTGLVADIRSGALTWTFHLL